MEGWVAFGSHHKMNNFLGLFFLICDGWGVECAAAAGLIDRLGAPLRMLPVPLPRPLPAHPAAAPRPAEAAAPPARLAGDVLPPQWGPAAPCRHTPAAASLHPPPAGSSGERQRGMVQVRCIAQPQPDTLSSRPRDTVHPQQQHRPAPPPRPARPQPACQPRPP